MLCLQHKDSIGKAGVTPSPLHPSPGLLTRFGVGGDEQVIWTSLESLHLWPALDEALEEGDAMEGSQLLPDCIFLLHG